MISVDVIRSVDSLNGLREDWNSLLASSEADKLFLSWDWVSSWIEIYLKDGDLFCLAARERDKIVGLAPLWIDPSSKTGLVKLRTLKFLGSTEVCPDHLDFLVSRKKASGVARAMFEALLGPLSSEWDAFEYHQVPSDSAVMSGLWNLAEADSRCVKHEIAGYSLCPFLPLPPKWEDYVKALSENQRRSLKISNRFLDEQGELELKFCTEAANLESELKLLMDLNQKSWNQRGESGSFATERVRGFHALVAKQFLADQKLFFCSLWLDKAHIGSFYGFEQDQKIYFYVIAIETNPHPRVSIVRSLLARTVEAAINKGCVEFDMLRGDEPYKYQWTDQLRRNLLVNFYNRSLRTFVALGTRFMIDYGKSLVKSLLRQGQKASDENSKINS